MTALSSRLFLNQPDTSNSKKKSNQGNRQSLNVFQPSSSSNNKESVSQPSSNSSKKELNQSSISSLNVSKSSISTKEKQSNQGKELQENFKTDKSQRPVLGIADTNEKLEKSKSSKSPSNSISSALPTNKNDGNNTDNFEEMEPRATSSPRGHGLASDISCEDYAKDPDYEPHSNDEVMRLQYEKISKLEKAYTKLQTTVEKIRQLLLNRTEVLHHPKSLPSLPFPTLEDAKTAEDLTNENPSIKDYIVKKLMFASSGKCEKDCSKKVMALLMTNHTGAFFNWKGGKGKQLFESWHLKETVITTVKKLRGDKLDTGKAEDGIKEWFKERCFRKNNISAIVLMVT